MIYNLSGREEAFKHTLRNIQIIKCYFCMSVQFSCSVMSHSLWPCGLQHAMLPCPSPTPGACSHSYPLSQWCHPSISSSVLPFSSCLQSFPASGWFPMSNFFASGGQNYWSFSFSISPSNEYSWLISFRMDWLDLLAVQGTLKIFFNTTVQKHQFFSIQLSLWSNSHIHTWLLEKPQLQVDGPLLGDISAFQYII